MHATLGHWSLCAAPRTGLTVVVMLRDEVEVPAPALVVTQRLLEYLRIGGLQTASAAAVDEGETIVLRAGVARLTKQVAVQTMPPYHRGETLVVPLRWSATGPLGDAFPALDANLELEPTAGGHSRLVLTGSYRPPLGRLGATLDRVLLGQVARATARSFLTQVAGVVAGPPAHDAPNGRTLPHGREAANGAAGQEGP